ncbi:aconitase X catalytic domain-containing protein [Saxibacter everestensis]|uniref:Aconitase X catalytic domain-containing protein n=1 Tax=Saxibacter everestensis TaxID=2909229 RepID=A0ABY8QRF0_9MICO|nr:aconitase X catalytic domain-containing protein [Brevibacteriaceae bacterium ZFBP1038]
MRSSPVMLRLRDGEREMLAGDRGEAVAMAMRVVVSLARAREASELIDVTRAHIDSCLFHGRAGLDFARKLRDLGGQVAIPTTLNVGSLDLMHPDLIRDDPARYPGIKTEGRELMQTYLELGARPTWTCAPYHVESRPAFGEHIAWAESNAIVFANSVFGARTDRYGDFLDICAAITGKAPRAGLHLDQNRRAEILFDCEDLPAAVFQNEIGYALLGYLAGLHSGGKVPVFSGLPDTTTEDQLKALGSTSASSGSVALFHVVGVTPEAPSLAVAMQGQEPELTVTVTVDMLRSARRELTSASGDRLDAVSVGTPHASLAEIRDAAEALVRSGDIHPSVDFYISTGRAVYALAQEAGYVEVIERAGGRLVVDTCTYVTPILKPGTRTVLTNSGKWAHYAPANLGVDVAFGSLEDCVRSACAGRLMVDDAW